MSDAGRPPEEGPREPLSPTEFQRRRTGRARVTLFVLLGLVGLIYAVTIIKREAVPETVGGGTRIGPLPAILSPLESAP